MSSDKDKNNNSYANAALKLIGFVALVIAVYYAADIAAYTVMSMFGG